MSVVLMAAICVPASVESRIRSAAAHYGKRYGKRFTCELRDENGERFWLVVYPRQITSLRHVWTHPAFPEAGERVAAEPAVMLDDPSVTSKKWLEDFAESVDVTYSQLLRSAARWVEDGDYTVFDFNYHENIPDEFWDHYERVTGESVGESHRGSFFTCSC